MGTNNLLIPKQDFSDMNVLTDFDFMAGLQQIPGIQSRSRGSRKHEPRMDQCVIFLFSVVWRNDFVGGLERIFMSMDTTQRGHR